MYIYNCAYVCACFICVSISLNILSSPLLSPLPIVSLSPFSPPLIVAASLSPCHTQTYKVQY